MTAMLGLIAAGLWSKRPATATAPESDDPDDLYFIDIRPKPSMFEWLDKTSGKARGDRARSAWARSRLRQLNDPVTRRRIERARALRNPTP